MSELRQTVIRMLARPAGSIGFAIVALTLLVAVTAPLIAPYDPAAIAMAKRFAAPSFDHWLGTDHLGRDNLSRVIHGTRLALTIAFPAVLSAFAAGLLLGLVAGYVGGLIDRVLTVIADTFLSFPSVILGLALLTLVGQSVLNTTLVIALSLFPYYLRLARGLALSTRHQPYIKAERSLGAGRGRIMFLHLLPNMLPPLLVVVAMDIPSAIVIEAGLAFLGLGVPPPAPDWGVLLNEGFVNVAISAWPLVGPLMAIIFVTTGFTLLGETFRDIADPRLAGLGRRTGRFLMRRAR
ncbi:ABC transporter permease subunit [Aestuariivirga sp. YIM B02566]|uniref:ABC transporter permease n=1 Tax=Taklimakanibacter albus TaxID=2800327 RepID=A0ACC5QXF5_9HYPH|nr:ABC transporter permease [Aestuariivirga sp. YIM B02566]